MALAKVRGPEAGLAALTEIRNQKALEKYYLFYTVLAEFHLGLKKYREAEQNYRRALALTDLVAEKKFLSKKLDALPREGRSPDGAGGLPPSQG